MAQYTLIDSVTPLNINGTNRDFQYYVAPGHTTTTTTTTTESGTTTTSTTTTSESVADDDLIKRQTLTETGFAGTEGADWDAIESIADEGAGKWRVGVRDAHWVIDCAVDATGFAGAEDINWINVEEHCL